MNARPFPPAVLGASLGVLSLALACTEPEEPFTPIGSGGSSGQAPVAGTGGTSGATTGGTAGSATVGGSAGTTQGGTAGTLAQTGGVGGGGAPTGGSAGSLSGAAGSLGGTAGGGGVAATGGDAGAPLGGASGVSGAGGAGSAGLAGMSGSAGAGAGMAGSAGSAAIPTEHFSFFVTSVTRMKDLARAFGAGNEGFGGDLRYGEATGLAGADKICRTIAGLSMPGAENKTWRAFLSTVAGPVHAIDRIGEGPWYDRLGRVVAMNKNALLNDRPQGADPLIINDLPNEDGIPNHTDGAPGCTGNDCPDNHDTLTGTGEDGHLHSTNQWSTCFDWTNGSDDQPEGDGGGGPGGFGAAGPWCGHSWPRQGSGVNWMSALAEGGCAPGINLVEMGPPQQGVYTVGTGGGYGGIYCFALQP